MQYQGILEIKMEKTKVTLLTDMYPYGNDGIKVIYSLN